MDFRRVKSTIRRVPAQKTGFTVPPYKSETELNKRESPPIDVTDDQVYVKKIDSVKNRIEMKQKFAESIAKRHKKWAKRVKAETGLEIPKFDLNKYTCRYRLTVSDPTPESKFGCVSLSSPRTHNFTPRRCIIPRPLPDIPMCARLKEELLPQRLPRPVTWVPRDPLPTQSKQPTKKASSVRKVDPCVVKYYCDDLYSIPSKYRPEGEEIDPYDSYWKNNTLTVLSPVEFSNDCVRLSSPKAPSYLNPDKIPTLLPWPHPRNCKVKEDDVFWEQKKVTDDFYRRLCVKPPPVKKPPLPAKPKKKPPPKIVKKVEVTKAVTRKPFLRYRDPCERVTGDSDALEQFFKDRGISSSKTLSSASAPEITPDKTLETKQITRTSQSVFEKLEISQQP